MDGSCRILAPHRQLSCGGAEAAEYCRTAPLMREEGAAARTDRGQACPRGERAGGGNGVRYVENRPRFIRDLLLGQEEEARTAMEAREARGPQNFYDEEPMMVDSEGNVILPSDLSRDDDLADEPGHGSDYLHSEPSSDHDGLEEHSSRAAAAAAANAARGEARAKRARTQSKLNKVHTSACRLSFDQDGGDEG